jgi:hypothetical protein
MNAEKSRRYRLGDNQFAVFDVRTIDLVLEEAKNSNKLPRRQGSLPGRRRKRKDAFAWLSRMWQNDRRAIWHDRPHPDRDHCCGANLKPGAASRSLELYEVLQRAQYKLGEIKVEDKRW